MAERTAWGGGLANQSRCDGASASAGSTGVVGRTPVRSGGGGRGPPPHTNLAIGVAGSRREVWKPKPKTPSPTTARLAAGPVKVKPPPPVSVPAKLVWGGWSWF